ncbi:helix-turn-helix domain-containing protein [Phreatobacter sp.]|uniref:helix-turn-helix domain-containing protein n=1 Tax=Phreatobacter sp. TaxID=1966341 RepID=UPI003F70B089
MEGTRPCAERFMLVGPERVFYAGLLGRPRKRTLGSFILFCSMEGRLELSVTGEPAVTLEAAVLPAYREHSIQSEHRCVIGVLIEPESVDPASLARLEAAARAMDQAELAGRLRAAYRRLRAMPLKHRLSTAAFDAEALGEPLVPRRVDPRIARVLGVLGERPGDPLSAQDCAALTRLSVSRFLHLFKQETGHSFRALRAWKRARHLLNYANETINMAHLALDIGYPDSTHFSHSIRRFYGLQPRAIFSGSRELEIFRSGEAAGP